VKSLQKNGKITEDQRDDALGEIQKLTDTYISRIDEMINAKEKDISSV
jgi:ribosome recycling factor